MKILLIWPYFYPEPSAAAVRGCAFAKYLQQEKGTVIEVVAPKKKNIDISYLYKANENMSPIKVNRLSLFSDPKDIIKLPISLIKLRKIINYFEPDLIISSSTPSTVTWEASIIAKLKEIPFIMDVRDPFRATLKSVSNKPFKHILAKYFEEKSLFSARLIFTVTKTLRKMLNEEFRVRLSKIEIVNNGTDLLEQKLTKNRKNIDAIFIGSLTNLGRDSNFLISSCRRILEKLPDTNFNFIGCNNIDNIKKYIKKEGIENNIKLISPIPHEEIPFWLSKSKIGLAILNQNQVFKYQIPVKVYEYIGNGLPIAAYGPNEGELKNFIEANRIGFYASTKEDFIRNIIQLLENHELWAELNINAVNIAEKYDRKIIIQNAYRDYIKPLLINEN